ncbi:MAG: hypothetical protein ABEN55_22060, partial [Bradymonadaceae bacterium]
MDDNHAPDRVITTAAGPWKREAVELEQLVRDALAEDGWEEPPDDDRSGEHLALTVHEHERGRRWLYVREQHARHLRIYERLAETATVDLTVFEVIATDRGRDLDQSEA